MPVAPPAANIDAKKPVGTPPLPPAAKEKPPDLVGTWVDTSGAIYHISDDGTWDSNAKQGKFSTHISGTLAIRNRKSVWTTANVEVTCSDPDMQEQVPDMQSQAEKDYLIGQPQNGQADEPNPNELIITIGSSGQSHTLDLKRDTQETPTSG